MVAVEALAMVNGLELAPDDSGEVCVIDVVLLRRIESRDHVSFDGGVLVQPLLKFLTIGVVDVDWWINLAWRRLKMLLDSCVSFPHDPSAYLRCPVTVVALIEHDDGHTGVGGSCHDGGKSAGVNNQEEGTREERRR